MKILFVCSGNSNLGVVLFIRSQAESLEELGHQIEFYLVKRNGAIGYLKNIKQCIFGQSDPYQMLVNGDPGRYFYANNNWHFDSGSFNKNQFYDLRMNHILKCIPLPKP